MNTVIGCSLNSQIVGSFISSQHKEKLELKQCLLELSGSTANVALALNACECEVSPFGLVGPEGELGRELMILASKMSELPPPMLLEVLDKTSLAFLPIELGVEGMAKLAGMKGRVDDKKVGAALAELESFLENHRDSFGVVTSLREQELPFGNTVLDRTLPGGRVLTVRDEFCHDQHFLPILSKVNCLVLNEVEFRCAGSDAEVLLNAGPRVVVLTKGKEGGECYVKGEARFAYEPHVLTTYESPGTGDWFLGALVAYLVRRNETFLTVSHEVIRQAVNFASEVAGHKACYPGATNGPANDVMRQLLCKE